MKPIKRMMKDPLGRKITFASDKMVKKLKPWIRPVLIAVGHPEAFVTDDSSMYDFFGIGSSKAKQKVIESQISKKLGFSISVDDKIIDVAAQIKQRQKDRYEIGCRKLVTGHFVQQYDKMIKLQAIESKCPDKWNFVDLETGDVWRWDWQDGHFVHSPFEKVIVSVLRKKCSKNNTRRSTIKQRTAR